MNAGDADASGGVCPVEVEVEVGFPVGRGSPRDLRARNLARLPQRTYCLPVNVDHGALLKRNVWPHVAQCPPGRVSRAGVIAMKPLRAYYYPYSQLLNLDALKRALLIFDELWLSDPLRPDERMEFFIRDRLMHNEDAYFGSGPAVAPYGPRRNRASEEYDELLRRGVIRKYDVTPLVRKHGVALGAFLQADLQDPAFLEWHRKWLRWVDARVTWAMLRERIPDGVVEALSKEAAGSLAWLFSAGSTSRGGRSLRVKLQERYAGAAVLAVPTVCASSLLINEALAVADQEDLHLFTDSHVHHHLLSAKLARAASGIVATPPTQRSAGEKAVHQLITLTALDSLVSPEALAAVGLLEIVEIRSRLRRELERFRDHVAALQSAVDTPPSSEELSKQVHAIVDQKLKPELAELDAALARSMGQAIGRAATKVVTAVTPTMIVTALSGLTPGQILAYASAAAAGAFGIAAPEIVEHWRRRAELARSPLAFALRLRQELDPSRTR